MGFFSRIWDFLTWWLPSTRRRRDVAEGSMLTFDHNKLREEFRRLEAEKAAEDARKAEDGKTPPS
jgi:hypothetical protein